MNQDDQSADRRSLLERILAIVTEVHAGEGVTALLLTLNVFLLLTAYYIIKPVREALILVLESGAEYKSYLSAAIAIALLGAVPAYSKFADRVARNRLVVSVTLFFASHLILFYVLSQLDASRSWLGMLFYVWVGMFNLMVVAQFWAFANDLYTEKQGERLFALVGVGASIGAAVGSLVLTGLIERLNEYLMLLCAAGVLVVCALLFHVTHLRESRRTDAPSTDAARSDESRPDEPDDSETKPNRRGGFALVMQHRYLRLLALYSLTFTIVNTNGEYMLAVLTKEAAQEAVAQGVIGQGQRAQFIGQAYGTFYLYVNVLGVLIQTFLVSRIIRYGGLKISFFIFPMIALGNATAVALFPLFHVLRAGKVAENATDYSLNNTLRHMLWLPTTRDMKYKAKQAVDTFFVRMGDVTSAGMVYVGAELLNRGVRTFAILNIALVMGWLWLARSIVIENRRTVDAHGDEPEAAPAR